MSRRPHGMKGDPDAAAPGQRTAGERLPAALASVMEEMLARPVPPGLHLVATPIGNLADVTLRALALIAGADLVWCEDTRHTFKLLNRYGIARSLRSYQEHNAQAERPRLLAALAEGRSVALLCDAGTPLVSDPGFKLVREAIAAGHAVTAAPGPSAVLAALSVAGLPTDRFLFAGFLPPRPTARRAELQRLGSVPATLVLFEAPGRLAEALADMADVLGAGRPAAVARELTKLHEEVVRGTLSDLAARAAASEAIGEHVVLVGPAPATEASDADIETALATALAGSSLRDAVRDVAGRLGCSRKRVYALAVAMRGGASEP